MDEPVPLAPFSASGLFAGKRFSAVLLLVGVIAFGATAFAWWHQHSAPTPPALDQAATAFNKGDLDGALASLNHGLAANPDDVELLIMKSLTLSEKGSLTFQESVYGPQAAAVAQQAIQLDATSSEAYRALGYANEIQQKYDDAHAAYQKAISLDPRNALAIFDDGHAYDLQGDAKKAEPRYVSALSINPKLYIAHLGLGRIDTAAGKLDDAFKHFHFVYESSPNENEKAQAAYSIGINLMKQKNTDLARGYFEKAVTFDPHYPSGWYGLGVALYEQSISTTSIAAHTEGALMVASINDLNKAVTLYPNNSLAVVQLAQDYYVVGQKAAALSSLSFAKSLVPKDITLSATDKAALLKQIDSMAAVIQKSKQ